MIYTRSLRTSRSASCNRFSSLLYIEFVDYSRSDKMDNKNVIVSDNGTGYVKCGFARENFPTSVFPYVVGRPLLWYEESLMEQEVKDIVVGETCAELRHQLDINYPVHNGIVQK